MHKKKVADHPSLQDLYNDLRKNVSGEMNIHEFCHWTSSHPFLTTPVVMLQLHLRSQIIGEKFWIRLSNERKKHPEFSKIN